MLTPKALADLCAEAYTNKPTWQVDNAAALSVAFADCTVVAFRGTQLTDPEDIFRDLDAWPVFVPKLGVLHRGFWQGAHSLLPFMPAHGPLVITGHSLGGAMAIDTVAYMVAHELWRKDEVQLVTFGAPRAGGGGLRKVLKHCFVEQYEHVDDPIPPEPWFFDHVVEPTRIGVGIFNPIANHFIYSYQMALAAMEQPKEKV